MAYVFLHTFEGMGAAPMNMGLARQGARRTIGQKAGTSSEIGQPESGEWDAHGGGGGGGGLSYQQGQTTPMGVQKGGGELSYQPGGQTFPTYSKGGNELSYQPGGQAPLVQMRESLPAPPAPVVPHDPGSMEQKGGTIWDRARSTRARDFGPGYRNAFGPGLTPVPGGGGSNTPQPGDSTGSGGGVVTGGGDLLGKGGGLVSSGGSTGPVPGGGFPSTGGGLVTGGSFPSSGGGDIMRNFRHQNRRGNNGWQGGPFPVYMQPQVIERYRDGGDEPRTLVQIIERERELVPTTVDVSRSALAPSPTTDKLVFVALGIGAVALLVSVLRK